MVAGDWFSLYVYWELMALASTFVILAPGTTQARRAALRYVLVHLFGGLLLLAGIMLRLSAGASLKVGLIGLDGQLSSWLIFAGIALNAAVPPLHPWLKDAYPRASAFGILYLSVFTTKSAVYLMARTFAGSELLIYLGAIMTLFPMLYAVLEDDVRTVLCYGLINQVGFMVTGIGIGSQLALNGVVAHAICHILYEGALFMAAGSVLTAAGKIRCSELGGLYKSMPLTCICCLVGAASIGAVPLFSGFVSKTMIVSAAGQRGLPLVWLALQFASAGVVLFATFKVPYFMFFGRNRGLTASDPPGNMLWAMLLAAGFSLGLGIYPRPLYNLLPYAVDYLPYSGAHVMGHLQVLMAGALVFTLLRRWGFFPAMLRDIYLDFDWFYRRGGDGFYWLCDRALNGINRWAERLFVGGLAGWAGRCFRQGPANILAGLLRPVHTMRGRDRTAWPDERAKIAHILETGSTPLGYTVAAGALMVIILWALR